MKNNQDEKKSRHFGSTFLALAFAAVFCFAAYKLGGELLDARREKAAFDDLAAIVSQNAAQSAPSVTSTTREVQNETVAGEITAMPSQSEAAPAPKENQAAPSAATTERTNARDEASGISFAKAGEATAPSNTLLPDAHAMDTLMPDADTHATQKPDVPVKDVAVSVAPEREKNAESGGAESGDEAAVFIASDKYESNEIAPADDTKSIDDAVPVEQVDNTVSNGIVDVVESTNVALLRPAMETPLPEPTPKPSEPLPEYVPIYEMNPDFYGWLAIDGTNINYPVMFAPDKHEYYLKHAFDGSDSSSGVPFIDDACLPDVGFCIIHGHHMKDKTMFGQLPQYASEDFWKEHPIVRFDSRFEHREYAVACAFLSRTYPNSRTDVFRYYAYTDLTEPQMFEEYAEQVKAAALYDTGVELNYGDELLVLSTCNYHTSDGRFVVVAKRIVGDEEQRFTNLQGEGN